MFRKLLAVLGVTASTAAAAGPAIPTDYAELVEMARAHVSALQVGHNAGWRMDEADDWAVDLNAAKIQWLFNDGVVASAPLEFLGTWNPQDQTFLWAWDHPSATPQTQGAALAVKRFADENGVAELQLAKTSCAFDACWDLVSTAAVIADLQGVYRAEAAPDGPWAYFGFGNVTLSKPDAKAAE